MLLNILNKPKLQIHLKDQTKAKENLNKCANITNDKMQEKIDYYFTPYNRRLAFNKFMKFEEEHKWTELTDFILNEDKEIFRKSLNSINNGLYLELENVAKNKIK